MKRLVFTLLAMCALASSSGCGCLSRMWCHHWGMCPWGGCQEESCGESCGAGGECASCSAASMPQGHGLIGEHHHHHAAHGQGHFATDARAMAGAGGPPTGAVAYPYYTNRGPRDFLADDPQSIGP